MTTLRQRKAAQAHWTTIVRPTPFTPRIAALMEGDHWGNWSGFRSAQIIKDQELEYFAIRSTAAVFDVSAMTKYRITGPEAGEYLNRLTLRNVAKLGLNRVQYTAWCDDDGQVLDDGTLFRLGPSDYRLCSQERHLPWLLDSAIGFDVQIREETEEIAGLALQGPTSAAILRETGFTGIEALKPFDMRVWGDVLISRTGFTGDLGYELWVGSDRALSLWDRLFEAGRQRGIRAIGYAALNIARIETGFIVANSDFTAAWTALREDRARRPDEIGLAWLIDLKKGNFTGRRALVSGKPRYMLAGLQIEGNIPAEGALIYHGGRQAVGTVTAACWSPTGKKNIAMASMKLPYGDTIRTGLEAEIYALRELRYHKMMKGAHVVTRPFVVLPRRTATPPADF